ncbi:stage V sporulation protein AA [Asaccharospora irregularis]|uniref:Stage V sporulation protein AA n=1 Tax=Asaccharospora irregularis DSM 2635 TaxID=1121321 RepID=A0A1M5JAY0_9FIRM|nr:stage V sporulation protein AA [Asaccharospora irregularis]SHG37734.1 stage V sporulation protein AA [Asaccharospora irregularis DSM 2635]
MKDIYLIPIKTKSFDINKKEVYLKDVYEVYPENYRTEINDICLRCYDDNNLKYDVIHLGEVIEAINKKLPLVRINFTKLDDVVILFERNKRDSTKLIRVLIVSIVVLMGSIMGIMNFHSDVNMMQSQSRLVDFITNDSKTYLPYFQIPYSLGIGIGVALFFNKFIPTYSRYEPSPLDLRMVSLDKEIKNQLMNKRK